MNLKTSNYGAARGLLGLIEIVLWCGVGIGVIVALAGAGAGSHWFGGSGVLAAVPGIAISFFCFFHIVDVQTSKATVDTADYTYQMLSIARDQLAVSKQGLAKASVPAGYADNASRPSPSAEPGLFTSQGNPVGHGAPNGAAEIGSARPELPGSMQHVDEPEPLDWDYRGMQINRTSFGYLVEGHTFDTVDLAKRHVDSEVLRARMNGVSRPGS